MFRLRSWLLVLFGILTVVPLIVFGVWNYNRLLQDEFRDVEDRHLLLAQNLGAALQRYHRDVTATFDLLSASLIRGSTIAGAENILRNMELRHICVADAITGAVSAETSPEGTRCPDVVPAERLGMFQAHAVEGETRFTPVGEGPDGLNVMFLLRRYGDKLAVGALKTDYFVTLGRAIAFGHKGHAAIVDQQGNVLAHPLESWRASRKNIAQVSAVRRMMNGETGIEQFYSPALKGDMIAGLTSVPGPGWGVMIPQPIAELESKAARSQNAILALVAVCLLVVFLISYWMARFLSMPLERLTYAAEQTSRRNQLTETKIDKGALTPVEHFKMQQSFNQMVQTIRSGNAYIKRLAYGDRVSGLPNRDSFETLTNLELKRLRAEGAGGAMVYVDLDDFKAINDTLGHHTGDGVLRVVARRTAAALEDAIGVSPVVDPLEGDEMRSEALGLPVLGRVGGDEFAAFIPGIEDQNRLSAILQSIRQAISKPIDGVPESVLNKASIGASFFPQDGNSFDDLLKRADIAMYHAKHAGKDRFQIYSAEIGEQTVAEIRRDVRAAIKRGELVLYYQPKLGSNTHLVESVEALVRWNHPERGLLHPSSFIPMINNSDVTIALGEWVVRQAIKDMRRWDEAGINLKVGVNISSRHFASKNFIKRLRAILRSAKFEASRLEIEITEETVVASSQCTNDIIHALHELGFAVSLDDYGRGYSNLTRLSDLQVDTIKIDGPLIARITNDERTRVIVASTIEMARGLGCKTVAEGVEHASEAALLAKLGCDELQGFHFARPMPEQDLRAWLQERGQSPARQLQNTIAAKLA